tara:strand:+ start:42579 stop:42920 length:342 start_codon:yes stop_codon:yes gene_type:complete
MSSEKKVVYVLDEDMWINYLYKIDDERKVLENLLFISKDSLPLHVKSVLCEHYSFLYNLEEIINEMADEEHFDPKTSSFLVTKQQAIQFSLFLEAIVSTKEQLLKNNYSISLH